MSVQSEVVLPPIAWPRRIRLMIAAGGIPSTTVAAIGDFFSPRGGWMLPLGLGIVAAVIVVALLVMGTNIAKAATRGDEGTKDWWDGPRWRQLGLWVIASFAACAIIFGAWSKSKAAEGGVLGANVQTVALAQQQMGLLTQIADNTHRTAEAAEAVRDTVKRETSLDPRKELANLGLAWDASGLNEAIRRRDLAVVQLYLEGGMPLDAAAMREVLKANPVDPRIEQVLVDARARARDVAACTGDAGPTGVMVSSHEVEYLMMQDLTGAEAVAPGPYPRNEGIAPAKARLWAHLCAGEGVERDLGERIKWWNGVAGGDEAIAYYEQMLDLAREAAR